VRRVVGLILAGLGAFFLVLALLVRFYVPGQVVKFPLNEYQVSSLHDPNGTYFSADKLQELTGLSVTATDTIEGDVSAGNGSRAVWNEFTAVHDDNNNVNFSYYQRKAPFDRRTGLLLNCCGAFVNQGTSNKVVHLSGQGLVWPFNAEKKTYQLFDTTLNRPIPATFGGTATIDGMPTYIYVERVSPQQTGTQTVPGTNVGLKDQPSVTLPEYYQAVNTYWVDPVTGGPVKVEQNQLITLKDSTGATRLVLFKADLKFSPASIKSFVAADRTGKNKITLVTSLLPLILLLLGVVLLAAGLALAILGRGQAGEPAREPGYQPQDQGLAPH
jgi:Porin PorA